MRADVEIYINGVGPIYRPHRNTIHLKADVECALEPPQFFDLPNVDGERGACGWVMHHDYLGAIPRSAGIRGVRLRSGNIQVGGDDILVELFAEPRFNSWAVAEVYILDRRIVPNGRRDQYEQSTHFANIVNQLVPLARTITGHCRSRSMSRQRLRNATMLEERIHRDIAIVKQGAITKAAREQRLTDAYNGLEKLAKLAVSTVLSADERDSIHMRVGKLETQLAKLDATRRRAAALERLNPHKRRAYEEVFSLTYACAADARAAKELVGRILAHIR